MLLSLTPRDLNFDEDILAPEHFSSLSVDLFIDKVDVEVKVVAVVAIRQWMLVAS